MVREATISVGQQNSGTEMALSKKTVATEMKVNPRSVSDVKHPPSIPNSQGMIQGAELE